MSLISWFTKGLKVEEEKKRNSNQNWAFVYSSVLVNITRINNAKDNVSQRIPTESLCSDMRPAFEKIHINPKEKVTQETTVKESKSYWIFHHTSLTLISLPSVSLTLHLPFSCVFVYVLFHIKLRLSVSSKGKAITT